MSQSDRSKSPNGKSSRFPTPAGLSDHEAGELADLLGDGSANIIAMGVEMRSSHSLMFVTGVDALRQIVSTLIEEYVERIIRDLGSTNDAELYKVLTAVGSGDFAAWDGDGKIVALVRALLNFSCASATKGTAAMQAMRQCAADLAIDIRRKQGRQPDVLLDVILLDLEDICDAANLRRGLGSHAAEDFGHGPSPRVAFVKAVLSILANRGLGGLKNFPELDKGIALKARAYFESLSKKNERAIAEAIERARERKKEQEQRERMEWAANYRRKGTNCPPT